MQISMLQISIHGTLKGQETPEQVHEIFHSLRAKQRTEVFNKFVPDTLNPAASTSTYSLLIPSFHNVGIFT